MYVFSVRSGDAGLQRFRDGDALDDAGCRVLNRRHLCASGAARLVHLLTDALSLCKLAGRLSISLTLITLHPVLSSRLDNA